MSEANDLKRTPEALAIDLGYELNVVQSVINGKASPDVAHRLLTRMCDVYPISIANVWVEPNDTIKGVKIMRAGDSKATSRIFSRTDHSGNLTNYYEYRDTVMSSNASFKPEWIKPLRIVDNDASNNPDVAYNRGHLMHQCTFFIGEVNFYWEVDGTKYCVEMNTGDSNYITPFVAHSFTSRNKDKLGIIVAVTFGGEVHSALNELANIGILAVEELSENLNNATQAFKSRLDRYLNAESMEPNELIKRLIKSGMKQEEASQTAQGKILPSVDQMQILADVLYLQKNDLSVTPIRFEELVEVKRRNENRCRPYPNSNRPAYHLKELARTRHFSGLRGLDVTVIGSTDDAHSRFRHHLHEYIYNYGDTSVQLNWSKSQSNVIRPGDSVYVQPMIEHSFTMIDKINRGQLVIVRIPGVITNSIINEFSKYPSEHRARVTQETDKWF